MRLTCRAAGSLGLILAVLTGCGADSRTPDPARSGDQTVTANGATLSQVTGEISLPLDRFGLSEEELRTQAYAYRLALNACMARSGNSYPVIDRTDDPLPSSRRYGLWVMDEARATGYRLPTETPAQKRIDRASSRSSTPAALEALRFCGRVHQNLVVEQPLASDLAAFEIYSDALRKPSAVAAIRDWHRCLAARGVKPPRGAENFTPADAPNGVGGRRIALVDVTCKDKVMLVRRLANTEAGLQNQFIARFRDRLIEQRDEVERVLARVEGVIAREG